MDISQSVGQRLAQDNPWWASGLVGRAVMSQKPRPHIDAFHRLVIDAQAGAVLLTGPARSGRTYMLLHAIQRLLDAGADPKTICRIGLESPAFGGLGLDALSGLYMKHSGRPSLDGCTLVLDDAHYMPRWESAISEFSASHPRVRIICSSAISPVEGGFAEYRLPLLQFFEYLEITGRAGLVKPTQAGVFDAPDIDALNAEFIAYINAGGFPEAQSGAPSLKGVLRADLASASGIDNPHELYRLLGIIAHGSGEEVTLEGLSDAMAAAKNTVKKYMDFLESSMLIARLQRVDLDARPFERANFFRPYVCHPSLRAAIWGACAKGDPCMAPAVSTAVMAQLMHSKAFGKSFYYARWPRGTADMVYMRGGRPASCTQIQWSDELPESLPALTFIERNEIKTPLVVTTITRKGVKDGINLYPASLYCYQLGWNITRKAQ